MNGYPSYPPRQYPLSNNTGSTMMDMAGDGMQNFDIVSGQSLDDIVSQNEKANRRRSMPVYGQAQTQNQIANELRPAIQAALDDLDRWLTPATD